jgi:hypothetical protein
MVVGLIFLGLVSSASDIPNNSGEGEDLRCYRSIVDRIRSGEGYYKAAYSELLSRGYPTGSVFNWRTPLLGWTLATSDLSCPNRSNYFNLIHYMALLAFPARNYHLAVLLALFCFWGTDIQFLARHISLMNFGQVINHFIHIFLREGLAMACSHGRYFIPSHSRTGITFRSGNVGFLHT